MTSTSGTGAKRSRPQSRTSDRESARNTRPHDDSRTPTSTSGEEYPGLGNCPPHVTSSSCSATPMCEGEEMVITSIRAADVALGLRRIPVAFYSVVHHSGLEWKTENKRLSMNDDVEWSGTIPLPSVLSATVCLEVYASFEFQSLLGSGEQLRRLTTTTKQLLDRGAKGVPFTFFPKDGDVVSPCSSIFVTVKERMCERNSSSMSSVLDSHCSATGSQDELEGATNQGHRALSCYQKQGRKLDLERSIDEFERALKICPLDHPHRAAAQLNLATARFILYQLGDTNTSLEVPLSLCRYALATRPVGHPDRPATLIQLAAVHFARFEKQRVEAEGARAEALLCEAMSLSSPESHESRAAAFLLQLYAGRKVDRLMDGQSVVEQFSASRFTDEDPSTLSVQLFERFERFGDLTDLQKGIAILEKKVGCTSVWDDQYPIGLGNLGLALYSRFERLGDLNDLENAITKQREGVELIPHGHPHKPIHLSNLAISLKARFTRFGELSDLEGAISMLVDAVDLIPIGHPDKPGRLNNLGISFLARFRRLGNLCDLENAILRHREAVALTPHDHPHNPLRLDGLGNSLRARFERLGDISDLDGAIAAFKNAVDLTPHDHPGKPARLSNLGSSFRTRFERLGELGDLEDAISMLKDAVDLTPHGHPDMPNYLIKLGNAFITRFKRFAEPRDLDDAISTFRDSVGLTPHGHPDKPISLNNLGNAFLDRFQHLGEWSDLDDAISLLSDAIDLTPHGDPGKPARLSNLGQCLKSRFERLDELGDLESAISMIRTAIDLTPNGHTDKPGLFSNLGNFSLIRFERLGELNDLEYAISMARTAVDLTPHDCPDKPMYLNNLADSFFARFDHLGELPDLDNAILSLMDAVQVTPHDHPEKPRYLYNLGINFITRFDCLGELKDLEDAILRHTDAIDLIPSGHDDMASYLNGLGKCIRARFECLGEASDLQDAILKYKGAVDLTPHGHPDRHSYLNNLGDSFRTRFEHLGELSDLENAVSTLREAVELTPHDHPHRRHCLNNLGNCFKTRFERLKEQSDLEDAISTLKEAVDLTPCSHRDKPSCLNNLGNSFFTRFERLGELRDLEDAISRYKDAVDLTPNNHPQKLPCLNNLGNSLLARFKRFGEPSDIEGGISMLRNAVNLTPRGHPKRAPYLYNLGTSFTTRFRHLGELSDLERAIEQYSQAACTPIGPIGIRFDASQQWILWARHINHDSLLHSYSVSISLLPQLAWIGLPLADRYSQLMLGADVVREAAAAALNAGLPETAVEWLEQGRSIVWGELLQLRSSYEELSAVYPDHARRLQELSVALDHANAAHEGSLSIPMKMRRMTESSQREADSHRALAINRDKLLSEIRRLPGFERFLLQKEFSQLHASAHSGPVVILNAAESRCDALIVLADVDHVIHVPLPNLTFERSAKLQNLLKSLLHHARDIPPDDRDGRKNPWDEVSWEYFLSPLWQCVVKPVLDALAFTIPGDLSRIFWCPTGPLAFLPIHAAGLYDDIQYSEPGHKVFDFVVSSYVPTLSTLSRSSNPDMAPTRSDLRLLAVRQPPSDGLPRLPGVAIELRYIKEVIRGAPSACTTLLESSVGTVEEVLALMKKADWAHFACHGVQDGADSGLCLADQRRLKLRDIIALSRPYGGLAFLSACQTATGEKGLSDEAIHIAAGMLFAGYGGVIGTMWSISDKLAPVVARDVYEELFRNGRPDYRDGALALHRSIGRLRESGRASFGDLLPFIHVGL